MAKRYSSYEELSQYAESFFKPYGTMGTHDCHVTRHGGELVVIGSTSGWATLEPGDTLGYDCGNVWLLPRVEDYQDPIRRILAKAHLSQRMLEYSVEPVVYTGFIGIYTRSHQDAQVLGEHRRHLPSYWSETQCQGSIDGGEAVLVLQDSTEDGGNQWRTDAMKIVVRPKADKEIVAQWLEAKLRKFNP